ncbi:hypothetical protein RB200_19600 [Streptomyces sp. PmtG]
MIIPCVALAVSVAALAFVIRNGRKIKRLQRQAWADLSLTQIRNSATRYYLQRTEEVLARIRKAIL